MLVVGKACYPVWLPVGKLPRRKLVRRFGVNDYVSGWAAAETIRQGRLPEFLVVYFPDLDGEDFIPSAVLAVMGREKAFGLLSKMKGTSAVWIDGSGKDIVFSAPGSAASWQKAKRLF